MSNVGVQLAKYIEHCVNLLLLPVFYTPWFNFVQADNFSCVENNDEHKHYYELPSLLSIFLTEVSADIVLREQDLSAPSTAFAS